MTLRHASFFTGVGGIDLGFTRAGIATVSQSEIEPYASAVLAERYPGVPNLGDILKVVPDDIPAAEIYSGGFPCQDLSKAGIKGGLNPGTRSSLAFRFIDIVADRKPRWVLLENVGGLFTSNRGADFARILDELAACGLHSIAWRVYDSQYFGVAQRRRRVFIVASASPDGAQQVLFDCAGGCGCATAGWQAHEKLTPQAGYSNESAGEWPGAQRQHAPNDPSRMRTAHGVADGVHGSEALAAQTPVLSFPSRFGSQANVTENIAQPFAHSAGAPAVFGQAVGTGMQHHEDTPPGFDSHRYRCIANGVVAPVAEWIGRRIVAVDAATDWGK
jgi:DNA (cytosine-5)-methyltransferase 1